MLKILLTVYEIYQENLKHLKGGAVYMFAFNQYPANINANINATFTFHVHPMQCNTNERYGEQERTNTYHANVKISAWIDRQLQNSTSKPHPSYHDVDLHAKLCNYKQDDMI